MEEGIYLLPRNRKLPVVGRKQCVGMVKRFFQLFSSSLAKGGGETFFL